MSDPPTTTFDCNVRLPAWRVHVVHLRRSEGRELGNVMDMAVKGGLTHLNRRHPSGSVESTGAIHDIREALRAVGSDPDKTPPCSELLLNHLLKTPGQARANLAWEFYCVLTAKSEAPWSVLDREGLQPPLEFRLGVAGERLPRFDDTIDCEGLPVLADTLGVQASPWSLVAPADLDHSREPVLVCYLPEHLFKVINPKTHVGRIVWMTFAYKFVFERTFSHHRDGS